MRSTAVLPLLFLAVLGCGGGSTDGGDGSLEDQYLEALTRVRRSAIATLLYGGDNDDTLPPGPGWMDGVTPYVSGGEAFRSPGVPAPGFGFALNVAVAGRSVRLSGDPTTTELVFDSTVLTRNAVAGTDTLPSPGRHDGKNAVAFLDGHAGVEPIAPTLVNSLSRLRQIGAAVSLYASDWDDALPPTTWMDATLPYVPSIDTFRTPALVPSAGFGYAMNQDLPSMAVTALESPFATILAFDAVLNARNALASSEARPNPARYEGGNGLVFADGHAESRNP